MKTKKLSVLLSLTLCLCIALTGCSRLSETFITAYVQGNIDAIYLGEFSDTYKEIVSDTEEELEQAYLEGLAYEADYFANYWGIIDASYEESYADLDPALQDSIVDLYKEIYSHTKYEITSCEQQRDKSFAVEVSVSPIDIMEKASNACMNGESEVYNQFWTVYTDDVLENMTDEDYIAFTNEYGAMIVDMVSDYLDDVDYKEVRTQMIRVEEDTDGLLVINEEDFATFDSYVIYYP